MIGSICSSVHTPHDRLLRTVPAARKFLDAGSGPRTCRSFGQLLQNNDDPGEVVVICRACRRKRCTDCHGRWALEWLNLTAGFLAAHKKALHYWTGPASGLRAAQDRAYRAGVGLVVVRRRGGTVVAVGSGDFSGKQRRVGNVSEPCTLRQAIDRFARALDDADLVKRNPVSVPRGWTKPARPDGSGRYKVLATGPGHNAQPAAEHLKRSGAVAAACDGTESRAYRLRFDAAAPAAYVADAVAGSCLFLNRTCQVIPDVCRLRYYPTLPPPTTAARLTTLRRERDNLTQTMTPTGRAA